MTMTCSATPLLTVAAATATPLPESRQEYLRRPSARHVAAASTSTAGRTALATTADAPCGLSRSIVSQCLSDVARHGLMGRSKQQATVTC
jgi:hypothetical protein